MADAPSPGSQSPHSEESGNQNGGSPDKGRRQDNFIPLANINRVMRKALPSHAKIANPAKEMVQECTSEFISLVTTEANDICRREKRAVITGDDLLEAMETLGFENYIKPLELYLRKYREKHGGKFKGSARNKHG